ncbi:MAG TPA: HD domain-containing protein [Candidatus Nealsonbacteria bacterium]|nr:HD domain-containing protein [Candidatus Nealsonbacteria bacterium]HEB46693.1 HD domain-containing protein [Candidatus Nealsonbacteria bacterium]
MRYIMEYKDRIYGKNEIGEPIILELMKSKSMQRLKGIDQHGHFEPYFPDTKCDRFEHSVGVLILLKRFGASLEEQVAGLIHDVSHTVFSHVGDYVYGSEVSHDFQDSYHQEFIENSKIPEILNRYGIDYKFILDETNFPLKESPLPNLCADRIDYFLRDAVLTGKVSLEKINNFLDNLVIIDNLWVFKDKNLAREYSLLYLKMNNWFWSGLESAVMLKTMGELLKYAINKQVISKDDLFTTDSNVWTKIRAGTAQDNHLARLIERADNKFKYKVSDKNNYDLYAQVKSRAVDPLILVNNHLKKLSELDPEFINLKNKYLQPKEYYIKFLEAR